MWQTTHEATIPGLDKEAIWAAWADVDRWHEWQDDIEFARLKDTFREGGRFVLKPKGGPRVEIELLRVARLQGFTDLTRFPLARMYGMHDMKETADGVKLTVTIRVEGPLGWLWRKIVAQKVADDAPKQMASLVAHVRRQDGARFPGQRACV
jgi:hypothetical protein